MTLCVDHGLLGDAPQLPLLQLGHACGLVDAQDHPDAGATLHPSGELGEDVLHVALVGDVGAQVVQRVPHLPDHTPNVVANPGQIIAHWGAPLVFADDPVELEGEVGEGLADAVVEFTGDAGPLLVGADRSQSGEPAGVVDGKGCGLGEAAEEVHVARREMVRIGVLDGDDAHERAAGPQTGVDARPGPGRQARTTAAQQVRDGHDVGLVGCCPEGPWELVVGEHRRRLPPEAAGHVPCVVGGLEEQHGGGVEIDEFLHPVDGRFQHFAEVQGRGQVLGHLVEAEQQVVGIDEAAHAVEGFGLAVVGVTGDAPGVAGDHADQNELHTPLRGGPGVLGGGVALQEHRDPDCEARGHGETDRRPETGDETSDRDRSQRREDERRIEVAGGCDGESHQHCLGGDL